jgi:hypothetical protein
VTLLARRHATIELAAMQAGLTNLVMQTHGPTGHPDMENADVMIFTFPGFPEHLGSDRVDAAETDDHAFRNLAAWFAASAEWAEAHLLTRGPAMWRAKEE